MQHEGNEVLPPPGPPRPACRAVQHAHPGHTPTCPRGHGGPAVAAARPQAHAAPAAHRKLRAAVWTPCEATDLTEGRQTGHAHERGRLLTSSFATLLQHVPPAGLHGIGLNPEPASQASLKGPQKALPVHLLLYAMPPTGPPCSPPAVSDAPAAAAPGCGTLAVWPPCWGLGPPHPHSHTHGPWTRRLRPAWLCGGARQQGRGRGASLQRLNSGAWSLMS